MEESTEQVRAWKDVEARDSAAEHPAGEVTMPKRLRAVTRVAALAGYASALGVVVTQNLPTIPITTTTSWNC